MRRNRIAGSEVIDREKEVGIKRCVKQRFILYGLLSKAKSAC